MLEPILRTSKARVLPVLLAAVTLAGARPTPALSQAGDVAAPDAEHPIFQMGRRVMVAERLRDGERVMLDGRLDEAFWIRASPATDFMQQEPNPGATPSERTEVRIAFDRDNLYIGVVNFDSEPDRLLGNTMKRDEFLTADDRFMWTIDTFLDQQTGYFFEMNPSGLMADATFGSAGGMNREWDGIWDARARRSEIGWTLEIIIPFRTLNFDPNAPAWGINFQRTVRRKNEEMLWSGYERNQGVRRMSSAGLLVGIQDVSQGYGLDVRPYAAAKMLDAPGRLPGSERTGSGDVGLDLFYNLTPSLRANLTINTDFAETEVDQRQINLTRFPLQFPEKRAFFVEGGTFFDFPAAQVIRPFFSRSIGLTRSGQPQPIQVGSKLTGQAGRHDIGLLHVRTGADAGIAGEDFGVVRLRRRVLTQSYFGGLYTWRQERGTEARDRHLRGLDMRLSTSRFRGSQNLDFTAYWLGSTDLVGVGDHLAYGMRVGYPNDIWSGAFGISEIQGNFDPPVGFIRRRGLRSYTPSLLYAPRLQGRPSIRRLGFGGDLTLFTDMENRATTRELNVTVLRVETFSSDYISLHYLPTYERLERDFTIHAGITLPRGSEYDFTRYRASMNTANRRLLAVSADYGWGGFFSGSRREAVVQLGIRPRPGVTLNVAGERNDVRLPEGHFETRLVRFLADTQFNPRVYLVNNLQYDSVTDELGWQARFRWIMRPGNDLFVVYTHNWFEPLESDRFQTLERRAAMKVNYTRRI